LSSAGSAFEMADSLYIKLSTDALRTVVVAELLRERKEKALSALGRVVLFEE
jgi:hypothetical protein